MAKQKFYNFSGNSDFLESNILSPFDRKILQMHYDGLFQKEIARRLKMKSRAIELNFRRLREMFIVWDFYNQKTEKIKEILKKSIEEIEFL